MSTIVPREEKRAGLSVLLVHERFAPDYQGGGEYVVLETARYLQMAGVTVQVITAGDPDIKEFQGVKTQRLPVSSYRFNLEWRAVLEAAHEVDIIHAFTYHSLIPARRAATMLGKPIVCGVLGLFGSAWRDMRGKIVGRFFERFERALINRPYDARLFLSDFSVQLARNSNISTDDSYVIEPGISLEDYYSIDEKNYVLFAGKMDVRKGIDMVLEVAHQLPHVPFKVVGWGENYSKFSASVPPNVSVEPFVDREQLCQALAAARVFLFPTKAETFGLVIVEAMASGCAVVSTSPLPFLGAKLSVDDVALAVESVERLWSDPELCRQLGEKNKIMARQYVWPKHVDKLIAVYHSVIDKKTGVEI